MSRDAGALTPNFFIIGAQKAGTDSLYGFLKGHPHVVMAEPKEPHYFSRAPGSMTWTDYLACFNTREGTRAVGEASASYLALPYSANRIADRIGTDIRVIMILRNPVDRVYSSYLHMRKTRPAYDPRPFDEAVVWSEPDLEETVREETRRLEDAVADGRVNTSAWLEWGTEAPWNYRYIRNSWYRPGIERYLEFFDPSSVRYFLLDDLRADWEGVARDLFAFLDVDDEAVAELENERRNRTRLPREGVLPTMLAYRPVRAVGRVVARIRLGDMLRKAVRGWATHRDYGPMPEAARAHLDMVFAPETERLGRLVGRDLSAWHA